MAARWTTALTRWRSAASTRGYLIFIVLLMKLLRVKDADLPSPEGDDHGW
jgi:hypothetical protein